LRFGYVTFKLGCVRPTFVDVTLTAALVKLFYVMCDSIGLMCEYFIKCVFLLWTGEISLRIRVFLPCTGADSLRIRDILLCSGAISLHIRDIQPCTGAISLRICGIPLCISAASFRSCVSHFLWWGYFL